LEPTVRIAVSVLAVFLAVGAARGQEPVPREWFGTWILNVAKSTYEPGPAPYRRASYRIEPSGGDGLTVVYDMVYPRGGVAHLEWTGRLDGRDYPVQGIDEFMTYAYRRRDDGGYEVIVKVDGRQVASSTIQLSADGRTMTTTTTGRNASGGRVQTVTVYERESAG
jgi:hypothetical protein